MVFTLASGGPALRHHRTMSLPESDFESLPALVAQHARQRPAAAVLVCGERRWCWRELDERADRIAALLQARGLGPGNTAALCGATSLDAVAVFIGILRAGAAAVPLAPGSTPAQLAAMAADAAVRVLFGDALADAVPWPEAVQRIAISDDPSVLDVALPPVGTHPRPVAIDPAWPFNIIYSSGTTGVPKGIVQPHAMRWAHIRRAAASGYGTGTVTMIATPLYSNTTLVCLIPTLAYGGCAVLMPKFDAKGYLEQAQAHRATHTMLVPVQYRRLVDLPDFDRFDLSHFEQKFCTSAPFHAELKAAVLARWPGGLTEYYGLTEGGGTCILQAHLHPTKLHTVGPPAEGHDIRLIDEDGRELLPGATGEVVGRSPGMMTGYHGRPDLTREAEWFSPDGQRFLRTGDIGRFDDDGFLVLMDRRKDMVISGGFNIYPSDLEAVLRQHPEVADAAVVGVASREWGETPVAFCVRREGSTLEAEVLRQWANAQVGKTQRLSALQLVAELPRSAIGKVLKRELRAAWEAGHHKSAPEGIAKGAAPQSR
jgi:long-chain acyl-CoA synthetase